VRSVLILAVMFVSMTGVRASGVMEALKPAQALDALQRVQDAIAAGDASSLPLQAELIAIMDKTFAASLNPNSRQTALPEFILAYALAGGNRSVFISYANRARSEPGKTALIDAVSAYVEGDADKAQEHFEKVEPESLHPRLAPLVALAKGTANIRKNPEAAIRNFNLARLMAPGTLIEEAALRRTISLEVEVGSTEQFLNASEQYARRFIMSPYASQFVEAFVTGAVSMDDAIPAAAIAGILGVLPADRKTALCLRLTRAAVIAGRLRLAAFAASEALTDGALAKDTARSAQMELYAVIPELTKGDAAVLIDKLEKIDSERLPAEDRSLLRAALQILNAIARPLEAEAARAAIPSLPETPPANVGQLQNAAVATSGSIDLIIAANKQKLAAIDALLRTAR
jgi:chemotaxis protein MotC